jgi:hypothetical protein
LGGFLPGKFARPTCQKQHVGLGQLVFAVGPGHCLDDDATGFAVDAAHAVEEKDQVPPDTPDRNELELPIREVVVTGGLAGDSQNRSLGNPLWGGFGLAGCDDLE